MVDIAIVVVLYNKKIDESKTLQSLIEHNLSSVSIKIINNGPEIIEMDGDVWNQLNDRASEVLFENRTENAPLSKLYNQFISSINSDYYIILDDDSDLSEFLIENLVDCEIDLIIPKIYSLDDCKFYYPCQDGVLIETGDNISISRVMSISSGLTISNKLIQLFNLHYGKVFDERFALYGIDTSFFLRLHELSRSEIISVDCKFTLLHSLSRTQNEISRSRTIERIYDTALTARHYPKFLGKIEFMKILCYYVGKFKFYYAYKLLHCYISGIHPRALKINKRK